MARGTPQLPPSRSCGDSPPGALGLRLRGEPVGSRGLSQEALEVFWSSVAAPGASCAVFPVWFVSLCSLIPVLILCYLNLFDSFNFFSF